MFRIRELNPQSEAEIALVAARMRQTLVEVLGEEKGTALYSMDWLVERVRWHLDTVARVAKIFLVEDSAGTVRAHAIARVECDEAGADYGYFATVFVEPGSRRLGLATRLVSHVESWLSGLGMPKIAYNTAENHAVLIQLFERQGFRVVLRDGEMVQLVKRLID